VLVLGERTVVEQVAREHRPAVTHRAIDHPRRSRRGERRNNDDGRPRKEGAEPLGRDVTDPRPVQAVAFAARRHESGIAWVIGAGHEKSHHATPPPQPRHRLRNDARIFVWAERAEHEDCLLGGFAATLWLVIGTWGAVS